MAENYSQNDFQKMQEQAIRKVKEMQSRSKPDQGSGEAQKSPGRPPITKIRQEEQKKEEQPKKSKPPESKVQDTAKNPLASFLKLDSDSSYILALLFFLGKEEADDMLLLALLYIMT